MPLRANFIIALSLFFYALAGAADAPAKTNPSPVSANPLGMVWGLLFLLALVVGAWWLIKRMGGLPMQLNRSMKVVAALSVGPRERVVLVDVAGQQLLLGVAPGRVNMLHRFEQPVIASDISSDNFGDKIRHVMQQVGPK
jgi:flagellar protein FliO/FliZ